MRKCKITIVGLSPYSQSRKTDDVPFLDRESHDDYDIRNWRQKCTVDGEGRVAVPAMAWKQCIDTAAYKLGVKVAGRRGATYKNFFTSGFFCEADTPVHNNGHWLKPDDASCVMISANSDGVRGSGKRVPRRFPSFAIWQAEPVFIITDDIITEDIFEIHVKSSGVVAGIGRFRPANGGTNGRFRVVNVEWDDFKL